MIKRIISLFRRPTPEEAARAMLRDLLQNLDKVQ